MSSPDEIWDQIIEERSGAGGSTAAGDSVRIDPSELPSVSRDKPKKALSEAARKARAANAAVARQQRSRITAERKKIKAETQLREVYAKYGRPKADDGDDYTDDDYTDDDDDYPDEGVDDGRALESRGRQVKSKPEPKMTKAEKKEMDYRIKVQAQLDQILLAQQRAARGKPNKTKSKSKRARPASGASDLKLVERAGPPVSRHSTAGLAPVAAIPYRAASVSEKIIQLFPVRGQKKN